MAGRQTGTFAFSANFEPRAAVPIDARMLVATYNDLLESSTWLSGGASYAFPGMMVGVAEDIDPTKNGIYFLKDLPTTSTTNWTKVGSASDIKAYDIEGAKVLSGFVNRTDSTFQMNGTSFEISPAVTSYIIYVGGKKFDITTTRSVTIANDKTLHYVYFDDTGTLQVSTSPWSFTSTTEIPVAVVFRQSSTVFALGDERHGAERNRAWHAWAHASIGTMYRSGLLGTFTNTTLSITQGVINDEDISFSTGSTQTSTTLWWRDGVNNTMTLERSSTTPYRLNGAQLQYDNNGTLTNVSGNAYSVSWVYATGDATQPIYTVLGQGTYGTLTAARNAALPEIRISTAEWKLIYRVIYRNTNPATYIEAADYRSVQTGVPSAPVTAVSHASLSDRSLIDSHPATAVSLDTTNFDQNLDASVVNVQLLAETVNDLSVPLVITTAVDNATVVVDTFDDLPNGAVQYDYYIESSSTNNIRSGTFLIVWKGSTDATNIAEFCTADIGITTDFTWSVGIALNMVEVRATAIGQYSIKLTKHIVS
jgi:hypothetical protein